MLRDRGSVSRASRPLVIETRQASLTAATDPGTNSLSDQQPFPSHSATSREFKGSTMYTLALPNPVPAAVVICLTLLIWFVIPVPEGVPPNAWHLFALFIGTIVGIISKAMPIGSLSMIAIGLVAITGVTNPG